MLGLVTLALAAAGVLLALGGMPGGPRSIVPLAQTATEPVRLDGAAERLGRAGIALPLREPEIIVHKSARRLELRDDGVVLREYPIVLGWEPLAHKQREGDGRTPEGEYYLCTRVNPSRYHVFLGISYPSPEDAAALDERARRKVQAAWDAREQPPWDTPAGGAIGIHGGGVHADWTAGCVAVANDAIEEIAAACGHGTRVTILP